MDYASWVVATPEIFLLVMTCVIALVDLGVQGTRRTLTYVLSLFTLAVVAYVQAQFALTEGTAYGFGNMVVSDPMGNWLKCFAAIAVGVTLVYGRPYAADRDMMRGGELFSLSLLALLGMLVIAGLLAFPLRDVVEQLIVLPAAYLIWLLGLLYRAVDQRIWWIARYVLIVVCLMLVDIVTVFDVLLPSLHL